MVLERIKEKIAPTLISILLAMSMSSIVKAKEIERSNNVTKVTIPVSKNFVDYGRLNLNIRIESDYNSRLFGFEEYKIFWHSYYINRLKNETDIGKKVISDIAPVVRATIESDIQDTKAEVKSDCDHLIEQYSLNFRNPEAMRFNKGCINFGIYRSLNKKYTKRDRALFKKFYDWNEQFRKVNDKFVEFIDKYINLDTKFDFSDLSFELENRISTYGNGNYWVQRHIPSKGNFFGLQMKDSLLGIMCNLDLQFNSFYFQKRWSRNNELSLNYDPQIDDLNFNLRRKFTPFTGGMVSFDISLSKEFGNQIELYYTWLKEF